MANSDFFNPNTYKYSPRFVNFHEVVNFILGKRLQKFNPKINGSEKEPQKTDIQCDVLKEYLEEAFDLFFQINYTRSNEDVDKTTEQYINLKKEYWTKKEEIKQASVDVSAIKTPFKTEKSELTIALANIKVYQENIKESLFEETNNFQE